MSMLSNDEVMCPDCRRKLSKHRTSFHCPTCGSDFPFFGGINIFLPRGLSEEKTREDRLRDCSYGPEAKFWDSVKREPWRMLLNKHYDIMYFLEEILPQFEFRGKVLDLSSGTCWLSSIIKNQYPSSQLYAADVSLNALEIGVELAASVFQSNVDHFVAIDSEALPFKEKLFDFVICYGAMHHYSNLPKALHEVHRVLKEGALFLARDGAAAPWTRPVISRMPTGAYARTRAISYGVREDLHTFDEWYAFFNHAGFDTISMQPQFFPRYRSSILEKMFFAALRRAPNWFIRQIGAPILIGARKRASVCMHKKNG